MAAANPHLGDVITGQAHMLDDRTLIRAADELSCVPLHAEGVDVLGVAYELLTDGQAGQGRGQYLTPGNVAAALAAMIDPEPGDRSSRTAMRSRSRCTWQRHSRRRWCR